jgi:hypothetical protein
VGKYCRVWQATDDKIKNHTRCSSWINEASDPHVEYVIGFAFPGQQWLCERAGILRYTYIACVIVILMVGSDYVRVKVRPLTTPLYVLSIWTHEYWLMVEREFTWGPEYRKKSLCHCQFGHYNPHTNWLGIGWDKPASSILRYSMANYGFHNKWNSRGWPPM